MEQKKSKPKLPLLVFDADCGFCILWIERWEKLTRGLVEYAPYQSVAKNFSRIPITDFQNAVQLILPDGKIYSAAQAVFLTLAFGGKSLGLKLYQNLPGFSRLTERIYKIVASNRNLFSKLTYLGWGKSVLPSTYTLGRWIFLRLLGIIYLIAFLSFGAQIMGLIGSRGILPISNFIDLVGQNLGPAGILQAPTLFWLNSSDPFLQVIIIAGVVLSILLIIGLAQQIALALLFILYLSLMVGGQAFMTFQWDTLLLETGFLAIFFAPSHILPRLYEKFKPSRAVLWLYRLLIFRLIFASGMVKLISNDTTWRNFTTLDFHYYTQPLPNPFSWYFHQLPAWFDRLSLGIMFGIELLIPFLIFAPRRLRHFGAGAMALLQILIILSGNYTFFNLLALALLVLLLDDSLLKKSLPKILSQRLPIIPVLINRNNLKKLVIGFITIVIGFLGAVDLARLISLKNGLPDPIVKAVRTMTPYRIVNSYGLFAVMTTQRLEIVVQGSNDGQTWQDYEFKYKPQNLNQIPLQVAPHQPRLDWQMWFAALGPVERSPWFINFVTRLLEGSPEVLALLKKNPFPNAPPKFIRAVFYDYTFTDLDSKKTTRAWWQRNFVGNYIPAVSLR